MLGCRNKHLCLGPANVHRQQSQMDDKVCVVIMSAAIWVYHPFSFITSDCDIVVVTSGPAQQ